MSEASSGEGLVENDSNTEGSGAMAKNRVERKTEAGKEGRGQSCSTQLQSQNTGNTKRQIVSFSLTLATESKPRAEGYVVQGQSGEHG